MGWIYWLRFPNGKGYIGKSQTSVAKRLDGHRRNRLKYPAFALYLAWEKYGEPECVPLIEAPNNQLAEREREFIRAFDTLAPNGYNMTAGGDGFKGRHSSETRAKISASLVGNTRTKGYAPTPATRAKLSVAFRGRKQSPEHVAKTTAAKIGRSRSAAARASMRAAKLGKKLPNQSGPNHWTARRARAASAGR